MRCESCDVLDESSDGEEQFICDTWDICHPSDLMVQQTVLICHFVTKCSVISLLKQSPTSIVNTEIHYHTDFDFGFDFDFDFASISHVASSLKTIATLMG